MSHRAPLKRGWQLHAQTPDTIVTDAAFPLHDTATSVQDSRHSGPLKPDAQRSQRAPAQFLKQSHEQLGLDPETLCALPLQLPWIDVQLSTAQFGQPPKPATHRSQRAPAKFGTQLHVQFGVGPVTSYARLLQLMSGIVHESVQLGQFEYPCAHISHRRPA